MCFYEIKMYKILLHIYFALRNTNSNSEKHLSRSNFSFAVYFLDKKPPYNMSYTHIPLRLVIIKYFLAYDYYHVHFFSIVFITN